MALTTPVNGGSGSGTTSATRVFTPAASVRIFVRVLIRRTSGGDAESVTLSDSDSGSYTELIAAGGTLLTGTGSLRQQLWTRMSSASPPSTTFSTGTSATADQVGITVVTIAGGQTDLSNIKAASNSVGDPTTVLDNAPAASSTLLNFYGAYGIATVNIPTGHTGLANTTLGSLIRIATSYDEVSSSSTSAWTSTNTLSILQSVEIKEDVITGTGAGIIAPLVGAGVGGEVIQGAGAGIIAPLTGAGVGIEVILGTGAGIIAPIVGAGSGAAAIVGSGAGIIAMLTGSGAGSIVFRATGAGILAPLVGEGVGVYVTPGGGPTDGTGRPPLQRPLVVSPSTLLGRY